MMKSYVLLASVVALSLFACSKKDPAPIPPDEPTPEEVITEVTTKLSKADSLSNFTNALKDLELTQEEVKDGVTIFAPLNDAEATPETMAIKRNHQAANGKVMAAPRQLAATSETSEASDIILKDHIVKGILKFADLTNNKILTALSGKQLKVTRIGDDLWINGVYVGGIEIATTDNQVVYATKMSLTGTVIEDVASPTTLQVTVYDATKWTVDKPKGEVAASADVILYHSREDYAIDKIAYQAQTNTDGIATFTDIPAGTYYIEVSQGDNSNILSESLEPINGVYTGYAIAGIFQSQSDLEGAAQQKNMELGNFKWRDLNGDGRIDTLDKTAIPYETGHVIDGTVKTAEILIGKIANVTPVMTEAQFDAAFSFIANKVSLWHAQFAVLDANFTDQVALDSLREIQSLYAGASQFALQANSPIVNALWTTGYQAIASLNDLETNVATMQNKQLATAKIKALRGYVYLQLHTYYGSIPLMQTADQVSNPQNNNPDAVMQFIGTELDAAANVLPAKSTDKKDLTSTAAKLLRARLALLEKDYAKAKTLTASIIDGGQYTLATTTNIYLPNSNEIIWDQYSSTMPAVYRHFFFYRPTLPYIRLTEAYLINTEANLKLSSSAATTFNMLLQRRGLPTVGTVTSNDLQTRWVIELQCEGLTFPAMLRWGTAANKLGYKGFVLPKHASLPIPQQAIDQNPGIMQNPGY